MDATLTFLGTGGSMGIPVMGCHCSVCQSTNPHNMRLRPSALLTIGEKNILFDAGSDLRTQILRESIDHLDGVIITHAHHDHTGGIDDLRVFNMWTKQPIPCLMSESTFEDLKPRYDYIFGSEQATYKLISKIDLTFISEERGFLEFLGLNFQYFTYEQGGMKVNGFRIGNFAYVTDICHYPETIFQDLEGVEIIVLSALRYTPSPLHFTLEEAAAFAKKVGVKEAWLTHIAHEVDHEEANENLPPNVQLAYDRMTLNFSVA